MPYMCSKPAFFLEGYTTNGGAFWFAKYLTREEKLAYKAFRLRNGRSSPATPVISHWWLYAVSTMLTGTAYKQ